MTVNGNLQIMSFTERKLVSGSLTVGASQTTTTPAITSIGPAAHCTSPEQPLDFIGGADPNNANPLGGP